MDLSIKELLMLDVCRSFIFWIQYNVSRYHAEALDYCMNSGFQNSTEIHIYFGFALLRLDLVLKARAT